MTSIAVPKACSDQVDVPATRRQLNAEVLLAAIDCASLPLKASTGCMRWIWKRCA